MMEHAGHVRVKKIPSRVYLFPPLKIECVYGEWNVNPCVWRSCIIPAVSNVELMSDLAISLCRPPPQGVEAMCDVIHGATLKHGVIVTCMCGMET